MLKYIACAILALSMVACTQTAPPEQPPKVEAKAEKPVELKTDKKADPKAEKKADPKTDKGEVTDAPKGNAASAPAKVVGETKGKPGHFGAPFAEKKETRIALDKVLADATKFETKTVQVTGKVSKVCRKKGCWFVLKSDAKPDQTVRITMKDYGFFVPTDCEGKEAVVEGTFQSKVVSEKMRKHLAEDEGKDPTAVKGDVKEYRLVATGASIGS